MNAPNLKIKYKNNTKHVILLIFNFKIIAKVQVFHIVNQFCLPGVNLLKPIIMLLVCATPVT